MEAIIFTGIQGAGKTTFYRERFFATHLWLSLDMLRTRHREALLLGACLAAKQPFVIDNTNPTAAERARYIAPAREAGFQVVGYHFAIPLNVCRARNAARPDGQRVPLPGLYGTNKRLQPPTLAEGFDLIHTVTLAADGTLIIESSPPADEASSGMVK
jgi:tRNA uridine 5-carbamoylmethylation protein Kti12